MKSVVITGSTRGIGLAMAKEFLNSRCKVIVSGRQPEMSPSLADELKEFGDKVFYIQCNVQKKSDIQKLWTQAYSYLGTIDVWINNAGQNSPYEFCHDTEDHYVDAVIDTNLKGVIFGSQVAAKNMLKTGGGQIWNMEGLGSDDMVQVKTILYGTTKRALTYYTKALAKELKGTSVTAGRLSPGMMLTDFITKTPEGDRSPVLDNNSFKFIFNTLGDRPEPVAAFLVSSILKNNKNNAHLVWLTKGKMVKRFALSPVVKRQLI